MDRTPEAIEALVEGGYDDINERFQTLFVEDFEKKPVEKALLEDFAAHLGQDLVCDVGCGPGPVARFLHLRGLRVLGVDLSQRAIDMARRISPDIDFRRMNLLELELDDASLGGLVAFYSIIHLLEEQVPQALAEFFRVLRPGGRLLVACYHGEGDRILAPNEGFAVEMYVRYFTADALSNLIQSAGFEILDVRERAPGKHEIKADRVFVLARK